MSTPTKQQVANRALWVEALRSGKYQKGKGTLRQRSPDLQSTCFCVWGVACDVIDPTGWRWMKQKSTWRHSTDSYGTLDAMGMHVMEDLVGDAFRDGTLIGLNDHGDLTFDELADLIQLHTLYQLDQLGGGVI